MAEQQTGINQGFLKELRQANIDRHKEWQPAVQELSLSFRVAEIAAELGELASEIKRIERARMSMKGGDRNRENIPNEIADVLISLDALAMDLEIDLETATRKKFNNTSVKYGLSVMLPEAMSLPQSGT